MLTTSGACRVDLSRPGKASQFGCNFKVRIITDNDVVRPCGRISGNIVIETRFPISHLGLLVQFEALCTMRYSSKFKNQTQFHNGRENILEGARLVTYYGYFDSPIHSIISPIKYEAVSADAYIISPGSNSYPFSMTIPEIPNLPAGFKNEYGSLVYRLAVYLKNAVQRKFIVEVGDKTMRFDGYCNLRNIELLPISVDCFYMKSMFSRKKVVEAHLLVQSSGFLRGESIPFRVEYKNPKCYPLKIFVRLVQNLKYNATNKSAALKLKSKVVKTVHSQIENDPIPEGVWMDFLCIPENQEPSYKVHFMYSVTYTLQFNVKIFLEIDQPVIKGEAPIYIVSTRDDIETLGLTEGMSNLDIPHVEARRRGSEASLNTPESGRSTKSLPPAYSQLSLRTPSWETLPPSYDELEPND